MLFAFFNDILSYLSGYNIFVWLIYIIEDLSIWKVLSCYFSQIEFSNDYTL
jgi:hypothetical protein